MLQCSRCGSGVPDDRTTCHICNSPLEAAPQATAAKAPVVGAIKREGRAAAEPKAGIPGIDNMPPADPYGTGKPPEIGGGGGEMRVSLTGETFEAPLPMARPSGPSSGGSRPGTGPIRPGTGPIRPAAPPSSRGGYQMPARRVEAAPVKSGKGGGAVLIVVLLLLIGGGAFGFWYYQKQQAPVKAATAFMDALKSKDWKALYGLMELPADQKSKVTAENFAQGMSMIGSMLTIEEYKVNSSTITGDTAKVNISAKATVMGQKSDKANDVPMKLVNGAWKLDASQPGGLMGLGGAMPK